MRFHFFSLSSLVALVCRKFAEFAIESNQAMRAIKPLRLAIKKLRPNSETLTPVHSDFLQVCLIAKNYNIALPIIEEEISDVNSDVTATTPRDLLLYYYYGGMIYTGLKQYKDALGFFKMVMYIFSLFSPPTLYRYV